ncbi:hypothetical protein ACKLJ2_23940 [Klebsiella quasipneumoniae subsp. similipneumoniae]|uniref:hypothetical protein n=1 Tax=Klebsiella quasipneumoniae TaxID=1463165 RepID=UPI003B2814E6
MTTDITELAQREKFEAWFVNDVVGADVNFPAFKDGEYTEGEIYDEQLYYMLQAMWMAWKAAGAEMVEALEKAQRRIIELVARKEKRLPVPYAYLRESDGQIQISIGAERPSDRSGGYATPWFPIYTATGIKVEAE